MTAKVPPGVAASPEPSPAPRRAPIGKPPVSEVVIGGLYPLTGADAASGVVARCALQTVVEVANGRADGIPWPWAQSVGLSGLGGARVRLVLADHQGSPDRAGAEAERLIAEERVHAMIGCWGSAATARASQVSERAGLPFVAPEASSPSLHARGLVWFFRTAPHDGQLAAVTFRFLDEYRMRTSISLKTLGLTYDDTLVGEDAGPLQKELAQKYGFEVVAELRFRARSGSVRSEVHRLIAANPDVWMPTAAATDAILLARTAAELGFSPKMLVGQGSGYADPAFAQAVGREAEGLIGRAQFGLELQDRRPLVRTLNALYRRTTTEAGLPATDLAEGPALTMTGMLTLVDAIDRAGSVEPREIRQALQKTALPPDWLIVPWRGVRFDATDQNDQGGALVVQLRDEQFRIVWPFELSARDVLYPFPGWRRR